MKTKIYHGLVGAFIASLIGCVANISPTGEYYVAKKESIRQGKEPPKQEFKVYPEYRFGASVVYTKTKLPAGIRTTPVHPEDVDFLTGETTTNSPTGYDLRPKAGAVLSAGIPQMRFYAGGELEWSPNSVTKPSWRVYETEKQTSDSLPTEFASFVFTELTQPYTLRAVAGLETILEPFTFRIEGMLPYSSFKVESGHYRFGKFETVQTEEWKGWGKGVGASMLYDGPPMRIGVYLGIEKFEPDFGGKAEVKNVEGGLQASVRF